MVEPTPQPADQVTVMTSAMLKALANPLRRRLVNELSRVDYARAADLAAACEVAANSVSFHLRVLAEAGLIEEAPEHARDRRERVWRIARISTLELGNPQHPLQDEAAGAAFTQLVVDEHHDLLRRMLAWGPEYTQGRDDQVRGTFVQRRMRLTRAEFMAAMDRVAEVLDEAVRAHDSASPDSHYWQMDILAADDTI